MSGFGRTGRWFAVEHWGVTPDIMTMAKGLTSGYAPLGCVAMKQAIADVFQNKVYQGGLTYNAHPISLAAAIANIQVFHSDQLVERAASTGADLADLLTELKDRHPSVGEVRSIGLFAAIELVRDRVTKEPMAPFGGSSPEMDAVRKFLLQRGLYLYTHWHTLLIIPPLPITTAQLVAGFSVIDEALQICDRVVKTT
jgi:taurine--2-oxoglutarate transaminase